MDNPETIELCRYLRTARNCDKAHEIHVENDSTTKCCMDHLPCATVKYVREDVVEEIKRKSFDDGWGKLCDLIKRNEAQEA